MKVLLKYLDLYTSIRNTLCNSGFYRITNKTMNYLMILQKQKVHKLMLNLHNTRANSGVVCFDQILNTGMAAFLSFS